MREPYAVWPSRKASTALDNERAALFYELSRAAPGGDVLEPETLAGFASAGVTRPLPGGLAETTRRRARPSLLLPLAG